MRTAFIEALCERAEQDSRIWLLTGDLGYSVLERFRSSFPERFVNIGVAEQNMTGVACGLALSGKIVFTYSIANFPVMRCLEQIRNDVSLHNLDVKIVAVGGGVAYGSAGYTHHAVEDLAVMRVMPNMTVVAPGDPSEARLATRAVVDWNGPCYLRLGKSGEPTVHQAAPDFQIGRAILVRKGTDVTIVSTGGMLNCAVQVAQSLQQKSVSSRVLSMHTVKPVDKQSLLEAVRETGCLVSLEDHSVMGGLSSAITEALLSDSNSFPQVPLYPFSLAPSHCLQVGSQSDLHQINGITSQQIAERILALLGNHSHPCEGRSFALAKDRQT